MTKESGIETFVLHGYRCMGSERGVYMPCWLDVCLECGEDNM